MKNKIADVDLFDGRFLLRIKKSFIKQLNADIKEPEAGDELWITIKYYCTEPGCLTAGFSGSGLCINRDIPVSEGGFEKLEVSGIWDGTGDFELHFTGDIYIETLALTTDPLENYKKEVSTLFEQTSEYITAQANALQYGIDGILARINMSGWITRAEGMTIWATQTDFNALGQTVSQQSSELTVLYDQIQAKVSQTVFNALDQVVASHTSSITQLADSITSKVSYTEFNSLGQTVSSHTSSITQLSNSIESKVSKTDFNALNNTVSGHSSNITQLADSITSKVSYAEFNSLGQTVSGHTSSITQLSNSIASKVSQTVFNALNQVVSSHTSSITQLSNSISSVVSSVNALTGEEIVSRVNQTSSSYAIQAKNINLNGAITANSTFKINTNGTMEATGGKIGNFSISGGWLTSSLQNNDSGAILMRNTSTGTVIGLGSDLVPGTAGGSYTRTAQIINRQKGVYETTALYLESAGGSNSGDAGYETCYPVALETKGNVRIRGALVCFEEVTNITASNVIANSDGSIPSAKRIGIFSTYVFQPENPIYVYLPSRPALEGYFDYFASGASTGWQGALTVRILVTRYATSTIAVKVGGSGTTLVDNDGNILPDVEGRRMRVHLLQHALVYKWKQVEFNQYKQF
ncbi:hypothetical protein FACS189438_1950 [Bacteroidia bacterium]|nr:hypothetical protein FACS189438_1950 [Bacteroidia bacterium]